MKALQAYSFSPVKPESLDQGLGTGGNRNEYQII